MCLLRGSHAVPVLLGFVLLHDLMDGAKRGSRMTIPIYDVRDLICRLNICIICMYTCTKTIVYTWAPGAPYQCLGLWNQGSSMHREYLRTPSPKPGTLSPQTSDPKA